MRAFSLIILFISSVPGFSAEADKLMQDFTWQNRVLLIFSPVHDSVMLNKQNALLGRKTDEFFKRDLVIIHISDDVKINHKPHAATTAGFLQRYDVNPDEFRIILVGKDGTVKLDQATAVTMQTLFKLIDAMPMRQYEIQQHGH